MMRLTPISVAVLLLAAAGCRPASEPLTFRAPARLTAAATSTDAELCSSLAVDFTIRDINGTGAVLDREPLEADGVCEWTLGNEDVELAPSDYRMLVRFLAAGTYRGQSDCTADGVDPVWVGAYWLDEVPFPFADGFEGFGEDSFLSVPDDNATVANAADKMDLTAPSFDPDGDGFDNLVELAGGSNPCRPNQPPAVTLTSDVTVVDEGEPVTFSVQTSEPDGLQHDVVLRLMHANGTSNAPETVEVRLPTAEPTAFTADEAVVPQGWALNVSVNDAFPDDLARANWQVQFVPDEPFVGELTVTAFAAAPNESTPFENAPPALTVTVVDLDDPVVLLREDENGDLVLVDRLEFAEVGATGSPVKVRLRAQSGDIGGGLLGAFTVQDGPDGLQVGYELDFTTLTWAPTNEDALAFPDGVDIDLRFTLDGGDTVEQSVPAVVFPQFNNPPHFVDLDLVDINLPPPPYAEKRFSFSVVDPDKFNGGAQDAPTCDLTVWPEGDVTFSELNGPMCPTACCTDAWEEITCIPVGDIEDDTWTMLATLRPSATYESDCGDEATFRVRLNVTDKPAPDADPSVGQPYETVLNCVNSPDPFCAPDVLLATTDITSVESLGGWPGELTLGTGTHGALIDGTTGIALVGVSLEIDGMAATPRVAIIDLNAPASVEFVLPEAELAQFQTFINDEPAAVLDSVNHRVVGYSRANFITYLTTVSLTAPFTVVNTPMLDVAPGLNGQECALPPVTDGLGNVYVPCGNNGDGDLLRINAAGDVERIDLTGDIDPDAGDIGGVVVTADDGGRWLLWPDSLGMAAVELATFDDVMPNVIRVAVSAEFQNDEVDDAVVTHDGQMAIFAYNQDVGTGFELMGVSIVAGAAVVAGPIVFPENAGQLERHRLVLREPDPNTPAIEADLITAGLSVSDTPHLVDLDTFEPAFFSRPAEDYQLYGLVGLFPSPDPLYYSGLFVSSNGNQERGVRLYPWDPTQPILIQDHGIPQYGVDLEMEWVATNNELKLMTTTHRDGFAIFRYLVAP